MTQTSFRRFTFWAVLAVAGLLAVPAWACSVPVFRYALEHWVSDRYGVVLFYRGDQTPELRAAIERLRTNNQSGDSLANVKIEPVDLNKTTDEQMQQLWKSQQTDKLPWMVVRYPVTKTVAWSGAPTKENVSLLVESPMRTEIARRLVLGQTGVWVLLESGDKAADAEALDMVQRRILHEQKTLILPEIAAEDIASGLVGVNPKDLKISFSVLTLSRSNAAEKMFVEMLLGSEPDLRGMNKPIAFPIFGRGRALYALVGAGINDSTIHEACQTLTGPCTCQVKDQNPGTDLVMSIDWEKVVERSPEVDKPQPPLASLGGFTGNSKTSETDAKTTVEPKDDKGELAAASPVPPISSGGDTHDPPATKGDTPQSHASVPVPAVETSQTSVLRNTMILLVACAAGVAIVSMLMMARKSG